MNTEMTEGRTWLSTVTGKGLSLEVFWMNEETVVCHLKTLIGYFHVLQEKHYEKQHRWDKTCLCISRSKVRNE